MTPQAEAICIHFIKWVYIKPKFGWCCASFEVQTFDFLKHPEYILRHYDFTKKRMNQIEINRCKRVITCGQTNCKVYALFRKK